MIKRSVLVSFAAACAAGSVGVARAQAPVPAPAVPQGPPPGIATPGARVGPSGRPPAAPPSSTKPLADTTNLPQFEQGVEFEPRNPNYKVSFSLEDADLNELVKVIGQLTGKRFIFGGKVRNIKASVYSPQKVTVTEAYQAFLAILETNGLTVVPHGRFLKIIETGGIATQATPLYSSAQAAPDEDRFVTRIHRLSHVSADEVAAVLNKFKSKDGDITVYGPGNLIIVTDSGTNIHRLLKIVEDVDIGGAGDQIWIEPVHYGSASDLAGRINELFDLKGGAAQPAKPGQPAAAAAGSAGSDIHVAKVVADDRSNSLIMVATERAYLRILEFLKRIDLPQSGEGEIHVVPLQHADATELVKTLNEIVTGAAVAGQPAPGGAPRATAAAATQPIFEGGVKLSADKSTNSIVITSSLRDYASVRSVVDKLDRPRRQVFIEAVIMDLNISRKNTFGVNFHGGDVESSPIGTGQTLIYGGLNPLKTILLPNPNDLQGLALGVRGPDLPGSQNLLGTGLSIPAFGVAISALETTQDADVLSTPHILATDNIAAEINVGNNIPLQANAIGFGGLPVGTGATAQQPGAASALGALGALGGLGGFSGTVQRQEIGTKIKIVPHLNESNEVRLEVTEEISDISGDPIGNIGSFPLSKRSANTTLVVKDQQTVVIGGLMRNRLTRGEAKIPILGDIPVLGALFRSSSKTIEKTNLILILTPYIIREQGDLRSVFERKMQERQEFLDRFFVFSDDQDYQPPKDYSRTNGLVEDVRQKFRAIEERNKLDELMRPRQIKTHKPGEPIELVTPARTPAPGAPAGAAPASGAPPTAPPATAPPPSINAAPPVRAPQPPRIEE